VRLPAPIQPIYDRHGEKLRFLFVGGWNTLFGLGVLWVLDNLLHSVLHYTIILAINWIIGVTQNLFSFKLLVFRTKGNWLKEYLRSYVVYAGSFVVNLAIVTLIMEVWRPRLVVAQIPAIFVVTIISYVGHKYFTYRTPNESLADTIVEDATGEAANGAEG